MCCSFTGTFGRIFHGVLLDEKDPAKEKQCFVKTVKGTQSFIPPSLYATHSFSCLCLSYLYILADGLNFPPNRYHLILSSACEWSALYLLVMLRKQLLDGLSSYTY
jgi:hypothetical protein